MWDEKTFADFVAPSEVKISPDGTEIAYVLTKTNLEGDRYEKTLVLRRLHDGGELYVQNASTPRFSFDGSRLVYCLSEGEQDGPLKTAVWLHDVRSRTSRKLFEVGGKVFEVDWSPDGRKLSVVTCHRETNDLFHYDDGYPFWFNGRGFLDGERAVVTVYDANGGAPLEEIRQRVFVMPVLSTLPYFRTALWHGNESLLLNAFDVRDPYGLNEVYVRRDGKEQRLLPDDVVSLKAVCSDGKSVVLSGKLKKSFSYLDHNFLYLFDGSRVRDLTGAHSYEDLSILGAEPKLDGQGRLRYLSLRNGRLGLYSLNVGTGEETAEIEEDSMVTSFDVSRDGAVAFVKESPTSPPEVYVKSSPGGEVTRVTSYNDGAIEKAGAGPLHHLKFTGVGGLPIEAWYLKPETKGAGGKAPVVLMIHGGPKGMYGYAFNGLGGLFGKMLASNGYYVLFPNPRGSAGYDEAFSTVINGRYGDDDFADLMQSVDELLAKEPGADASRLGVTGISGGGFLTNWAITHAPDRFKAAISENGICDWTTFFAGSDIGYWFCRELLGDDPFGADGENYRVRSPLYLSRAVKTPVLFIHSYEDYRCPPDQGIMFHHALKSLGKESYLLMFKKGEHAFSATGSPRQRAERQRIILEFMAAKLKGESGRTPSPDPGA